MLQEVRKHLQSASQREKEILKLSGHSEVLHKAYIIIMHCVMYVMAI